MGIRGAARIARSRRDRAIRSGPRALRARERSRSTIVPRSDEERLSALHELPLRVRRARLRSLWCDNHANWSSDNLDPWRKRACALVRTVPEEGNMLSNWFASTFALCAALGALCPPGTAQTETGQLITGSIDYISVDNPLDVWSAGKMVVGGQLVIIPRNLLLDLPANRLTLQQLFAQAPPAALANGESGLATMDVSKAGDATAIIHANRSAFGNTIAGEVFVAKGPDILNG